MTNEGLPAHRRPERDIYRPQPSEEREGRQGSQRIVADYARVPIYFHGDRDTETVRVSFRYNLVTGEADDVRVEE